MLTEKLPTHEEVLTKLKELLDAKKFDEAAKLIIYYSVAKMDPEEFAKRLCEAAEEYTRAA